MHGVQTLAFAMKKPRKTPTFIIILGLLVSANTGLSEEDFQTQANEPSAFVPGSWTVVVLPDTQYYVAEIRGNKEKGFKTVSKECLESKLKEWDDIFDNMTVEQFRMKNKAYSNPIRNIVKNISINCEHDGNRDYAWIRFPNCVFGCNYRILFRMRFGKVNQMLMAELRNEWTVICEAVITVKIGRDWTGHKVEGLLRELHRKYKAYVAKRSITTQ